MNESEMLSKLKPIVEAQPWCFEAFDSEFRDRYELMVVAADLGVWRIYASFQYKLDDIEILDPDLAKTAKGRANGTHIVGKPVRVKHRSGKWHKVKSFEVLDEQLTQINTWCSKRINPKRLIAGEEGEETDCRGCNNSSGLFLFRALGDLHKLVAEMKEKGMNNEDIKKAFGERDSEDNT